jgi:hypothetical protein
MLIKAFRLFVSSTFADFAAERDVLQGAPPNTSIYGQALGLKDQELSALEVKKIIDARASTNRDGRYGRQRSNEGASRC